MCIVRNKDSAFRPFNDFSGYLVKLRCVLDHFISYSGQSGNERTNGSFRIDQGRVVSGHVLSIVMDNGDFSDSVHSC